MSEIIIVKARLPGGLPVTGVYPGLLVDGPAHDAIVVLPARRSMTPRVIRLIVDGKPVAYFAVSSPSKPGWPQRYCWDDPTIRTISSEFLSMVRRALP